ncbi:recombinase family protein [Bacillus sp. A301a_S52]|jgi:site-specific DNA recombinase|nr:recombinase family protein [Bacillus sp. A301a_S52]
MENKKKIAVGYIRVSTEEQTVNFSLEYQEEHIRSYCEEKDLELKHIYNEGYGSGTSVEEREEFLSMMAECLGENNEIEYVVVLADHRFARNHSDAVNLVERMIKNGTNLICIADRINTKNRSDYDYFKNKSIHSERHRDEILFNCMYGMRQRAKNGLYNGGRTTGYTTTSKGLIIDPDSSEVVKLIFEKYVEENWGYRKIAQYLNTNHYKTINNGEFDINAVKTILSNFMYIGYIRFEGKLFEGQHEAIIDIELWEKAQKSLKLRSYIPEKVHHGSYFLTGLLKCPQCNDSMVHHVSSCRKYRYYKCLNNKNGKSCKANSVRKSYAEEYILSHITSLVTSSHIQEILHHKVSQRISEDINDLSTKLKRLNKDLTKISKKIDKTYEIFYKSNDDIHLKQIDRLNKEAHILSEKINHSNEEYDQLMQTNSSHIVDNLLFNFKHHFLSLEDTDKRRFLKKTMKEIHVNDGKNISQRTIKEIIYNVDIENLSMLLQTV